PDDLLPGAPRGPGDASTRRRRQRGRGGVARALPRRVGGRLPLPPRLGARRLRPRLLQPRAHGPSAPHGGERPDLSPRPEAPGAPSRRTLPPHPPARSEEHTSELQSREHLVCRLLLEKKKILAKLLIADAVARLQDRSFLRVPDS